MKFKDIPNLLSIIRLALVPVFIWLYLSGNVGVAICVFILAGATDVLDGYIARKYNCSSILGRILDPLADKLIQLSAFGCLYFSHSVPIWMLIAYFTKELLTAIGAAFVFKKKNFVVKSNVFGKLATVIVFAAVCVIAFFGEKLSPTGVNIICMAVCCYFVFSCLMYAKESVIGLLKWGKKDAKVKENGEQKA